MIVFSTMPKMRYDRKKKSQGWLTKVNMKTPVSLTEMATLCRRNWFERRTAGAQFWTFELIYT